MDYPADWEVKKLGDCATILQGGTPSTLNPKYWNGNIIWVTPSEITKLKSMYISDSERKITHDGLINSSATIVPAGTILLCSRATIGELAIATQPMTTNQGFKNLIPKENLNNVFLAYLLLSLKKTIISLAIGTTFLEISKKNLSNISIPLPLLAEQKAIAETLETFDAHIKNLSDLIEKKKAIRDGALEDLMSGRIRLKNFSGDWEIKKLGEIGEWESGSTPSRNNPAYYKNGKIFWVKNTDLNDDFLKSSEEKITEKALKENFLKIKKPGTILIAMYCGETVGKLSILDVNATTNQNCCACELYDGFYNKFIFYSLLFRRKEIQGLSLFGGLAHISKKIIINYSIPLPPLAEQKAIAETLTAFDDEIKALEAERDKIIKIRDGAMNDLLTGKVRLKNYGK